MTDPTHSAPQSADRPVNLLVIVGPTGVGKTKLSLNLARKLGGEIISADSRYLYKGLDIGTAKPTLTERALAPHHLIDVTTPDQPWSLAQYQSVVTQLIAEINARDRLPLLVGGTGQYVQAILEGWKVPPGEPDLQLRTRLEQEADEAGSTVLYQRLQTLDPAAAQTIDARNVRRVVRALEVTLRTGRPFSQQRQKDPPNYHSYILGLSLPRPLLYQRIDARIDQMLAAGLVAEVQGLADQGYAWNLPAMSAIGYQQIGQYLRGQVTLPEAIARVKHDTRVFVRRQANWFKASDPAIHWYPADSIDLDALTATLHSYFRKSQA